MADLGVSHALVGLFVIFCCLSNVAGAPESCNVVDAEKIPCGEPGVAAARCDALNCCFDGQQCYYGKAVTVQCTKDGQFILVVARDATLPGINLDSISLMGGNSGPCGPVDFSSAFAIYQFPVTACGTTMMVQDGYVIYENRMMSVYEVGVGPLGSITRDSNFEVYFQCRFSATTFEAVIVESYSHADPLPVVAAGPLTVELRLANGQCISTGCRTAQEAYTSYYSEADYPVTKVLREPVYVEVRILERTDPNIVLVLGRCWATTTSNPNSFPQWDLLVNSCPYQDDNYRTILVPVDSSSGLTFPTHYRRFVFSMFTFVEPESMTYLQEMVFIHCTTAVCVPNEVDDCEPRCSRKRRDVSTAKPDSANKSTVVSSGAVIFTDSPNHTA
ncbi:zona pellucida sperm-binding protein 4-like [Trichomycterus rosablanca]|uniref:zona pellucida sperm-binding protein 4-like n=1 Tax=Trichomycterus rosablanca TaxID=2290929 RepID=UPI002F34FFD7